MAKRNLYSRNDLSTYYTRELEYCEEKMLDFPQFKEYYAGKADGIRYAINLLEDKYGH